MTYPANVPSVVVIGKRGAGKTTVAQLLIDRFELGYERLSFADWEGREHNDPGRVVIDDVVYPNELAALKAAGFITIRVAAPVTTRIARLKGNGKLTDPEQLNHVSETALDGFDTDHRIVNDGAWADDLIPELAEILNKERA